MTEDAKSVEPQAEAKATETEQQEAGADVVSTDDAGGSPEVEPASTVTAADEGDGVSMAEAPEEVSDDEASSAAEEPLEDPSAESAEEGASLDDASGVDDTQSEAPDVQTASATDDNLTDDDDAVSPGEDVTHSEDKPEVTPLASRPAARLVVEGSLEPRPQSGFVKVLFGLTGISLVLYLGRLVLGLVLGWKRNGRLVIEGDSVSMEEKTRFVGREVSKSEEQFSRPDVLSVKLERRYPYLLTLLGLICLGLGVIAGIILLLDGVQGEFTPWIVSGVGLLLAGVVLDLVFTTLAASMPGQAALIVHLPGKRALRLVGCEEGRAEQVVRWMSERA